VDELVVFWAVFQDKASPFYAGLDLFLLGYFLFCKDSLLRQSFDLLALYTSVGIYFGRKKLDCLISVSLNREYQEKVPPFFPEL